MNYVDNQPQQDSLDLIMTMIFKMAFPVWERYHGHVTISELQNLEERGVWPRGLAARVMERIGRDEDLRKQLRAHSGWSTPSWDRE